MLGLFLSEVSVTGGESVESVSTSSKRCATVKHVDIPCPSCSDLLHDHWSRREQVTSALRQFAVASSKLSLASLLLAH